MLSEQEMDEMSEDVCPRCESTLLHTQRAMDALSRRDNETYVCSACGEDEAVLDLLVRVTPKDQWLPNRPSARVYEYLRDKPWPRRGRLFTFESLVATMMDASVEEGMQS